MSVTVIAQSALTPLFEEWSKFLATASGLQSTTWHNGAGEPADSLGRDGDYYLDVITGNVYQRLSGSYEYVTNITGPATMTLTMPNEFNVDIVGTHPQVITASYENQNANAVFAGPITGSPNAPTFRSLNATDMPTSVAQTNLANTFTNSQVIQGSLAIGNNNSNTASYTIAGGNSAVGDHYAGMHHASGQFSTAGDNQWMLLHPWLKVVNSTTSHSMTLDGSSVLVTLNTNNTAWSFKGEVTAKQSGNTNVNSYHLEGVIVRGVGVASVAIKWSTIDILYQDITTASMACAADTVNGALTLSFQDTAGGSVTWNVGCDLYIRKVGS